MENRPVVLGVLVSAGPEAGDEVVAEATSQLRRELLELDVAGVEPARAGEPPSGAKSIELVALGTLLVNIAAAEVFSAIVATVRSWIAGHGERSVKLELDGDVLELTGLSTREQQRLTEEWLRRRVKVEPQVEGEGKAAGARRALIVASYDYQDPGLRRLAAPARDANALAEVLRDPAIGAFEVRTMLNEPSHVIAEAVEDFFADRSQDDLLLLYFSCHGVKDEGGELFFATSNTKLRRLGATAVAADFVNRRMNRSRSRRIVLFLDCCYAGAFERGMVARAGTGVGIEEHFGGRGHAVITSSSALEYAFEGDDLADDQAASPSVFTSALVEGLETGDADRDQDGYVALDELYDYVYDRVREATPHQTPGKWTFAVQGDLHIARRSRPVTTPAPLPPELQQAIDHPIAGFRAGAVGELERLLQSKHAGLVLAARLALEGLADDDSRMVSAAASVALGGTVAPEQAAPPQRTPPKLKLSTGAIDFGRLRVDSRSPERRVQLRNEGEGSLDARATTTARWLDLQQMDDELVMRVDTAVAGNYDAVVTVDSDGGSATIRVRAGIDPEPAHAAKASTTAPSEPPREVPAETPPTRRAEAAEPAAAAPSAPEPSVAASPAPAPSAATPPVPAFRVDTDRVLIFAACMAIVGAALLVVSLFASGGSYDDPRDYIGATSYLVIMAGLMFGAGITTLVTATRRLIGPGLLLGAGSAASLRMLENPFQTGHITLAFDVLAHVILVLAACLAGFAVTRAAIVRVSPKPLESVWGRLVLLLGLAGAVAFFLVFFHDLMGGTIDLGTVPLIWGTALALVMPALAALAAPRRFSVGLLCGWIAGAAALCVLYLDFQQKSGYLSFSPYESRSVIVAVAYTLVTVVIAVLPFPSTAPIVGWSGCGASLIAAYIFLTNENENVLLVIAGCTLIAVVMVAVPLLHRSPVLGWAAGSTGVFLLYFAVLDSNLDESYSALVSFGGTLLAMLLITIPFARSTPVSEPEQVPGSEPV